MLRVGGVIFFFALSLFLTNFYMPDLVGRYDFTRATLLVLGGICMLGTNQAIIYYSGKFTAQDSLGSLKQVYKKMVVIILLTAIIFVLGIWAISEEVINTFFEKPNAANILWKISLSLAAFAVSLLNIDTLRALNFPLFSELYRNIFRYLPFFLAAVALYYSGHADWLVEVYLLGFFLLAIVSSIQVLLSFSKSQSSKESAEISYKSILKRSYPMALSAVTYFLMQNTDIILLGKFTDFDTVAYYSVAVKLAIATSLALQSVNVIIAPRIAEVFNRHNIEELRKIVRTSARLIVGLSLPALLLIAGFATFFLSLFGPEYIVAKNALLLLLLGQFFNTMCGPVAIYMNMTGRQHKLQQILLLGFLVNLVLNWYFIPVYGMVGAALATAVSMALWNGIAVVYTFKKDRIKTYLS